MFREAKKVRYSIACEPCQSTCSSTCDCKCHYGAEFIKFDWSQFSVIYDHMGYLHKNLVGSVLQLIEILGLDTKQESAVKDKIKNAISQCIQDLDREFRERTLNQPTLATMNDFEDGGNPRKGKGDKSKGKGKGKG